MHKRISELAETSDIFINRSKDGTLIIENGKYFRGGMYTSEKSSTSKEDNSQ